MRTTPQNLRVASIPVHRIHIHARRLVGSGYKVGVVRQTETRALKAASTNASTPFTRELTELYTASTWVEDLETVNGSRSEISAIAQNSLIAIVERIEGGNYGSDERVSIGLIAVQASTGSVVYDQFVDSSMRSVSHVSSKIFKLDSRLTIDCFHFSGTRDSSGTSSTCRATSTAFIVVEQTD